MVGGDAVRCTTGRPCSPCRRRGERSGSLHDPTGDRRYRTVHSVRSEADGNGGEVHKKRIGGFVVHTWLARNRDDRPRRCGSHDHEACAAWYKTPVDWIPRFGCLGPIHAGQHLEPCHPPCPLLRTGCERGPSARQACGVGDRWVGRVG